MIVTQNKPTSRTPGRGDVQFNNNSGALLTVTGVSEAGGNVQVINYGGTTAGNGILISGPISDTLAASTASIKEWSADIQESGAGAITVGTLYTQSKRGTLLMGANAVAALYAVNDPFGGGMQLNDKVTSLAIAKIIETNGNVLIDNSGGITGAANIQCSGTVTLNPNYSGSAFSGLAASHDQALQQMFGGDIGVVSPVVSPLGVDRVLGGFGVR